MGVLDRRWRLFSALYLSSDADPQITFASKKHAQKSLELKFRVRTFSYAS